MGPVGLVGGWRMEDGGRGRWAVTRRTTAHMEMRPPLRPIPVSDDTAKNTIRQEERWTEDWTI